VRSLDRPSDDAHKLKRSSYLGVRSLDPPSDDAHKLKRSSYLGVRSLDPPSDDAHKLKRSSYLGVDPSTLMTSFTSVAFAAGRWGPTGLTQKTGRQETYCTCGHAVLGAAEGVGTLQSTVSSDCISIYFIWAQSRFL